MFQWLKGLYVRFRLWRIERKLARDGWEGSSLTPPEWRFLSIHNERLYENLSSLRGEGGTCS